MLQFVAKGARTLEAVYMQINLVLYSPQPVRCLRSLLLLLQPDIFHSFPAILCLCGDECRLRRILSRPCTRCRPRFRRSDWCKCRPAAGEELAVERYAVKTRTGALPMSISSPPSVAQSNIFLLTACYFSVLICFPCRFDVPESCLIHQFNTAAHYSLFRRAAPPRV